MSRSDEAFELLRRLVESAKLDRDTGSVWIPVFPSSPEGRRFTDFDDLVDRLDSLVHGNLASFPEGFSPGGDVDYDHGPEHVVRGVLEESWIPAFFRAGAPPPKDRILISLEDLADPLHLPALEVDIQNVNEELIRFLAKHPERMYQLSPDSFEDLVAELFRDMGYEVSLTPRTKDGGKDVKAFRKEPFGTILTLVECKRYSPDRKVGVGIVRALYGVVHLEGASHGVIATTAFFTRDAKEMVEQVPFRLSLRDYDHIASWCRTYKRSIS